MSFLDPDIKKRATDALRKLRAAEPLSKREEDAFLESRLAEFVAESAGLEGIQITPEEVRKAGEALRRPGRRTRKGMPEKRRL